MSVSISCTTDSNILNHETTLHGIFAIGLLHTPKVGMPGQQDLQILTSRLLCLYLQYEKVPPHFRCQVMDQWIGVPGQQDLQISTPRYLSLGSHEIVGIHRKNEYMR